MTKDHKKVIRKHIQIIADRVNWICTDLDSNGLVLQFANEIELAAQQIRQIVHEEDKK